jgi:hypothetical protein
MGRAAVVAPVSKLNGRGVRLLFRPMKFFASLAIHALMGLLIGGGILLGVVRGQWWLLVLAFVAYVAGLYTWGVKPN